MTDRSAPPGGGASGQSDFAMAHKYPMISMNEAVDRVISRAHPLPQESVAFVDAVGRVVAEDFVAPRPHPPFAASVMDGYAVRSADCPGVMTLIGASRAGAPMRGSGNTSIQPGQCAYITTGAPLPPGADAVVPSEECRVDGGTVSIDANVDAGKWVRPVGFDIKAGETLVPAGSLVGAHEVGIVAAAGGGEICVHRKPKLALLSTGDELAEAGEVEPDASSGRIYDANRPMLAALAKTSGVDDVLDLGRAADEPGALASLVAGARAEGCDVLVTSGGVSEGDRDYLKEVLLGEHGGGIEGEVHFGRVMMKPGKPLTFAEVQSKTDRGGKKMLVFALPGNPVSAAVTFHLVVVPTLRRMMGWRDPRLRRVHVVVSSDLKLDPERPEYHRATLDWQEQLTTTTLGAFTPGASADDVKSTRHLPAAHSTGKQVSSRLTSMRGAEVLMELPRGPGMVAKGTVVSALVIGNLSSASVQLPAISPEVVR